MAALLGNTEGAIGFLQEAVDRGHWWLDRILLGDPDLTSLHEEERFQRIVEICRQRHAQAQVGAKPDLLVLTPESDPPWPLLIALHGAGGSAKEFAEYWHDMVAKGWFVGVPQSSQLIAPRRHFWGDQEKALDEVRNHFDAITRDYPVDQNRIVVAGFSQGGATAIEAGISGCLPVRGILGIACAPRDLDEVRRALADPLSRQIRVYLVVGDKDYAFERAGQFCEVLKSEGMATHLEVRTGLGHEMPEDIARSISAGLEFLLAE